VFLQNNVFTTPANSCLPTDVETMADMFKAQGYTTKMVGKYDALYAFFGHNYETVLHKAMIMGKKFGRVALCVMSAIAILSVLLA